MKYLVSNLAQIRCRNACRCRAMSEDGNDLISVAVDDGFVHMTWFDDRSVFMGTWYGRDSDGGLQVRNDAGRSKRRP